MVPTNQPKQLELFPDHLSSRFPAEPEPTPEPPSGTSTYWNLRGQAALVDAGTRRIRTYLVFAVLIVGAITQIVVHVLD